MEYANSQLIFEQGDELISSGVGLEEKRKVYVVREYEEVEIPISHLVVQGELQVYDPVGEGDFFAIYRKKGRLVFQAGGYVGLIPINDRVLLDVRPRVPLRRLERMMRIAGDTPFDLTPYVRHYETHDEVAPSMMDFFATALVNEIRKIRIDGLHKEYIQCNDDTSFPRGRVLLGKTMQRHFARGLTHSVNATWYEHSADTPPNRCLKYALWYIADHYSSTGQTKNKLLRDIESAYHHFDRAKLDKSLSFLNAASVRHPQTLPSIRGYYRNALYLATLIIRKRGISFANRRGGILMPSLLIDLKKTFESYVRNILRSVLRQIEPNVQVLDGNTKGTDGGAKPLFDDYGTPLATPDIVFKSDSGRSGPLFPLIADTKYKKFVKPERTEIEQAITYAASYRSPRVVIIHPRIIPGMHGLHLLGNIKPFKVYHYSFDLDARNPEREENDFARSIRTLSRY